MQNPNIHLEKITLDNLGSVVKLRAIYEAQQTEAASGRGE